MPQNQQKEEDFLIELESLFDIAHSRAFETVNNDIKNFLMDQRSKRRFHLNFSDNQRGNSIELSGNLNKILINY